MALPEGESAGLIAYHLGKETAEDGFQLLRNELEIKIEVNK